MELTGRKLNSVREETFVKNKRISACQQNLDSLTEEQNVKIQANRDLNFSMKIFKGYTITIHKPLIPMQMTLLLFCTGTSTVRTFFPVFLKQCGLSVDQVSIINTISVFLQIFGSITGGIIVDKIGRTKPVFIFFLSLSLFSSVSFIIMPKVEKCEAQTLTFSFRNDSFPRLIATTRCNASESNFLISSCEITNPANFSNSRCFECFRNRTKIPFDIKRTSNSNKDDTCDFDVNITRYLGQSQMLCDYENCESSLVECAVNSKKFDECNKAALIRVVTFGILISISYMSRSTVYRFMDLTMLNMAKQFNTDYGSQRIFCVLGDLIGPLGAGGIMQVLISNGFNKNYSIAFAIYIIFVIFTVLLVWKMPIQVKQPTANLWKTYIAQVKSPDMVAFYLMLLVTGSGRAFISFYSSWYLDDLGATAFLLGTSQAMFCLYGLPFLYISKRLIRKIGIRNCFLMSLLAHACTDFFYSILKEPWLVLLIKMFSIVYFHLFWVAVMSYIQQVTPEGMLTTAIVVSGGIQFNLGKICASMIGGMTMSAFGARIAFRLMATISLFAAVLYGIFLTICYLRRMKSKLAIEML